MFKQTGQEVKEIEMISASFITVVCSVLLYKAILCVDSNVRPRNISAKARKCYEGLPLTLLKH